MSKDKPVTFDEFVTRAQRIGHDKELIVSYFKSIFNGNRPSDPLSKERYCTIICMFYEEIDKDISDITYDDILGYLSSPKRVYNTKKTVAGRLAEFFDFAKSSGLYLGEISRDDILSIDLNSENTEDGKATPLTYDDICDVRNFLFSMKKYRYLINFELIYCYGVQFDELSKCTLENFDTTDSSFILSDGRRVWLPSYLKKMRECDTESFDLSIDSGMKNLSQSFWAMRKMINHHISINSKITYRNLLESHKKYGISCIICNNVFPMESDYWKLAKRKVDLTGTLQLVCRNCANVGVNSL